MQLPFTSTEFFQVFADYNEAVWPVQLLFLLMALVGTALIGVQAAFLLGMTPDLSLLAGGAVAVALLAVARRPETDSRSCPNT